MRYGIISDIHANLEALEVVLRELASVNAYLCLGDIVGYGASPNEVTARIAALPGLRCIAGNHDLAAIDRYDLTQFNRYAREAITWTQGQLTEESRSFLASLPTQDTVEGMTLVHGSLPDPMGYVTSSWEARAMAAEMATPVALIGHTHVAEYYQQPAGRIGMGQVSLRGGGRVRLPEEGKAIVNCGAVGQPRDGSPEAAFGILDTEVGTITVRRVTYPVDRAQKKIMDAGLPPSNAARLGLGR
jgi:diadenosine tetraphosphatase ApaH/serine/threonine PP2A family protein phosphatase